MSSKICHSAAVRSIAAKRGYAAQAATSAKIAQESVPMQDAQMTKLPNGMIVTSLENYSPVSKVHLYVKAGPRYENSSNLGISHALRHFAGFGTKNATGFGITRNIEQVGAALNTTTSREHMVFSLDCLRNKLDVGVKFLAEIALRPAFKPWEISDNQKNMKNDLVRRDMCPSAVVLDMLHKAAYRRSLGNSLFTPEYMIGKYKPDMLHSYVQEHFIGNNMVLVGTGMEHDQLLSYADSLFKSELITSSTAPSRYCGGELRIEDHGDLSYVAVATEGASLKNRKDMLCLGILQQILGIGPQIKWCSSGNGKLARAAAKATDRPHAVTSINVNYSDSGLFGFFIVSQANDMNNIMKSVVSEMTGITKEGFKDKQITQAKKQLKAYIHMAQEDPSVIIEDLALRSFMNGDESSLNVNINDAIDNISPTDVVNLAKKVITGKPSMAAVGNLCETPYLDQL